MSSSIHLFSNNSITCILNLSIIGNLISFLAILTINPNIGICCESRHKRRLTGEEVAINTKKIIRWVISPHDYTRNQKNRSCCHGGNLKDRAIRLDTDSFSRTSEVESGFER